MKNEKGFTLIELLTVVIILGIITTIAVPEVTGYIEKSKKAAFVVAANSYVDSVRASLLTDLFDAPVEKNDVTVINIDMIDVENGGSGKSPYNEDWVIGKSYVAVINEGNATDPKYAYYFAAQDEDRNAIPLTEISKITEKTVTNKAKNTMEVTIQNLAGNISGSQSQKEIISGLPNPTDEDGNVLDWNVTVYTNQ